MTSLRNFFCLSKRLLKKQVVIKIVRTKTTLTYDDKSNFKNINKLFYNNNNNNDNNKSNDDKSKSRLFFMSGFSLFGILNFNEDDKVAEPELIMTIKRSILLIQKGEYKKAEQMLHVALRQAQSIQSYDGVTYVYDVMANLAFEVGDIKKSKKLFTSVMQRLLSTGTMENDVKIIHMSLKMAKLCESSGEPEKAEDGYLFCLKHIQDHAKLTPDDEDILILWAMTLDWYAKMLLSQSRLSEALDYYLEAYQLCLKVNGKQHQQTVVLLNDLGTTYCLLGQHDQALDYLFEAIEIGKQIPDMQDLSSIYVNLGNVYLKKSMHNEAKQNCTKALTLSKKNNDDETKIQANYCLDEVNKLLK